MRFVPFFRGSALGPAEAGSAASQGYFILDGSVYFLGDEMRSELAGIYPSCSLRNAILSVRRLGKSGRLQDPAGDLLEKLASAREQGTGTAAKFVRELYPYQKIGVDWLNFCIRHGIGTILADDMGLGKTAQLIAAICATIGRSPDARILVVAPNPLLENWRREFAFFAPDVVPYLHFGFPRSGLSAELAAHQVVLTAYTTLVSDIRMLSEIGFSLAIFDEASVLKNPESSRSVAASEILSEVKIAVTGTPVENSLTDAWTLVNLVFPSYLGPLDQFRREYVGSGVAHSLSLDLSGLESSLRQITLRRMKKDVLAQLPPRRDIHLPVNMGEAERISYDGIICALKDDVSGGGANVLSLINRLQQFTSHPFLIGNGGSDDCASLAAASAKFELLLLLLDRIAAAGEKVLIFATFQKMIDLLASAVRQRYGVTAGIIDGRIANEARQPLIDEFGGAGGFAVMILHPRTAGMGFNITAASHVIHYSRQWNPALEMQATARAWRNGQTATVTAYYLFYAVSIEERIDERLRQKQELSDSVVSLADEKESDKQLMLEYLGSYGR
ncbi:ATP-dependent helicase [Pseudoduganella sp. FT93W]|uniref:ATP-dependent helicase n=1 Tax=Duganella fentianensis TaxID=2692177 RepID=A0A845I2J1_9BURK|nr:ATP-dependent helicase [Duganella fentianensis]